MKLARKTKPGLPITISHGKYVGQKLLVDAKHETDRRRRVEEALERKRMAAWLRDVWE